MVNPNHITPYARDPARRARARRRPRCSTAARTRSSASSRTSSPRARRTRAPATHDPTEGDGARAGAALPHPAPPQGRRRGVDRPQRREDRRGADAERGAAAGDEGGRRQVRRRRADPAVRAAVGRGDEARGRAAREIPRQDRGLHEGHGRARDGVRRRARHRQVAGQHDPHQQRLHGRRPRQAGADLRRSSTPRRSTRRPRSASRRCSSRPPSRCRRASRSCTRKGLELPGPDRRRRDQPRVRLPLAVPGRQGIRGGLRARRVLLQGRVRGPRGDGPADRRRGARRRSIAEAARRRERFREQGRGEPEEQLNLADDSRALGRAHRRADPRAPVLGRAGDPSRWTRSTATSTRTCCSSCTGAGAASKARRGRGCSREDFRPRLERMWREQDYLHPRALLGFFPCYAHGNEIVVLDPRGSRARRARALRLPAPAARATASAWPTSSGRRRGQRRPRSST